MLGCIPVTFNYVLAKTTIQTGSNVWGTDVSATGISNAEGGWTNFATSSELKYDIYLMTLNFAQNATSVGTNPEFLDIGVDPDGGTSYKIKIENLIPPLVVRAADSGQIVNHGILEIPIYIKAGSSVAIRIQRKGSTYVPRATVTFYGCPSNRELVPVANYYDLIGDFTNSTTLATYINSNFRASTTGYKGVWNLVGVARRNYWGLLFGANLNTNSISNAEVFFDIAVSPSYGIFKKIFPDFRMAFTSTESNLYVHNNQVIFANIKAGDSLYIRGASNDTIPDALNVGFLGIG